MSLICSIQRGQLSQLDAIFFYLSIIIIIIIIIIITLLLLLLLFSLLKSHNYFYKYLRTRNEGKKHTVEVVSL